MFVSCISVENKFHSWSLLKLSHQSIVRFLRHGQFSKVLYFLSNFDENLSTVGSLGKNMKQLRYSLMGNYLLENLMMSLDFFYLFSNKSYSRKCCCDCGWKTNFSFFSSLMRNKNLLELDQCDSILFSWKNQTSDPDETFLNIW